MVRTSIAFRTQCRLLTYALRSNVAPLVNNISGGTQASYPTFATALDAFMEAANRGAVELVLP